MQVQPMWRGEGRRKTEAEMPTWQCSPKRVLKIKWRVLPVTVQRSPCLPERTSLTIPVMFSHTGQQQAAQGNVASGECRWISEHSLWGCYSPCSWRSSYMPDRASVICHSLTDEEIMTPLVKPVQSAFAAHTRITMPCFLFFHPCFPGHWDIGLTHLLIPAFFINPSFPQKPTHIFK